MSHLKERAVVGAQSNPQGATLSESGPIGVPATSAHVPVPIAEDNRPRPTIEEAKAAQAHSRTYQNMMQTCGTLVHLLKRIEPFLKGTPLETPIAVLSTIVDVVEAVKDVNGSAEDTSEIILGRLVAVENALMETHQFSIESSARINVFVAFLVHRAAEMREIRGSSMWKKVLEAEDIKNKIEEIVRQIQEHTTNFSTTTLLVIESDTKSVLEMLSILQLNTWPHVPAAIYDSDPVQNAPVRRACAKDTRTGILDRIKSWAVDTSSSSPPIFWLCGMAGTGKSTIAYTICRDFDAEKARCALGASFFCSRQVSDLHSLSNIVPTLVYQLARCYSSFAGTLRKVSKDHAWSKRPMESLLVHPWQQSAKSRPSGLPPTLVVIDALDEIEREGGKKLLESLIEVAGEAGRDIRGLKFLVTSRPHPDIVATAQSFPKEAVYCLENINEQEEREDIMKFLIQSLPEIESSSRQKLHALADLSRGLFIYAATAVHLISPSPPRPPLSARQQSKKLSTLLGDQNGLMASGSETLPIDVLYMQIVLDAIGSHTITDDDGRLRLTILHSIICARQPLSTNILAELVAEDSEDVDQQAVHLLVQNLHAVLYTSNNHVYMRHKSFSDFILDDQRSTPKLSCRPEISHSVLVRGCFRIMNQSLRFNICNFTSSYLPDSEVDNLTQSLDENVYSIDGLTYVCRYWSSHLVEVPIESEGIQFLFDKLLVFSQMKALFWIEVMNLLAARVDCYAGVSAIMAWVNKQAVQRDDKAISELQMAWTAVSRLAKSFLQTPASLSTPHLYISSMATEFATNTKIPSNWRRCFPNLPQLSCAGISNHGSILTKIDMGCTANSVAFSPDGTRVVSGLRDATVCIWDASTGEEVQKLGGHTASVNSVAFSADGTRVVSGSYDHTVRIWDASTGEEVQKLEGHARSVNSVAFSPDGTRVVSGSEDHTVRIWDASTGEEVQKLEGHTASVSSVAFSPDGTRVVSGSEDDTVRIWDASTGEEVQMLEGHTLSVNSVAFSPDGTGVVSGSEDDTLRIWDASTSEEVQELEWVSGPAGWILGPDWARCYVQQN
ncbi:uncharacterized protein STEHIDRAFT_155150 [Stereum hirsutum FP-91666 SS1]|uniref:uncharacterized protein n=1 Tax=Stereum hirsutum (strain FP-91666) TaxID=721885 RepID=UPI000441071D|nr:uncharacterized protein STEHIDRAFT_155150 [Stereum hirsutum FP-91666 SS1]EIM87778.1 hypothetical protein STEHIDRAFT_155150 [Stereum hirsutum FP-91666 SS1]